MESRTEGGRMMAQWPPWDRRRPDYLARYVQPGVLGRLLPVELARRLPGPSAGPVLGRLRQIFEVLADAGLQYADEEAAVDGHVQHLRPPDQIFVRGGVGNCVDLAVAFSGACLDAGLHPSISVTAPRGRHGAAHALVVVWLAGSWAGFASADYPGSENVSDGVPPEILGSLRTAVDQPGQFVAVDVTAVTGDVTFDEAVTEAARLLRTGARWTVDIGSLYEATHRYPMPAGSDEDPLVAPYLPLSGSVAPLQQIRARHGLVRFCARDELTLLLDWCLHDSSGALITMRVMHGVGGAGKTHLAAELSRRLAEEGWHTGFLARHPSAAGLVWLGTVVSPLLIVVDYAETWEPAALLDLVKALAGKPGGPVRLLLTARRVGNWWHESLADTLDADGHPYQLDAPVPLSRHHPLPRQVFAHGVRAFAALRNRSAVTTQLPQPRGEWTTLDLVMLAWLAGQGTTSLPQDRNDLYREVLGQELRYWKRTIRSRTGADLPRTVLEAAAAGVSLLTPQPPRLDAVLTAIPSLSRVAAALPGVTASIATLIPADSDDGSVAVRPDPVADYLITTVAATRPALLAACIAVADPAERENLCTTITRAGDTEPDVAGQLAADAVAVQPELLQPALKVSSAQAGPFLAVVEGEAARPGSRVDLTEIAQSTPPGHGALRRLARLAAERTRSLIDSAGLAEQAAWWNNYTIRLSDSGEHDRALQAARETVGRYTDLADTDPNHATSLAMALNNLAIQLYSTGAYGEAADVASQAVERYRSLVSGSANRHLRRDLGAALNTLAVALSHHDEHRSAHAVIQESVDLHRQLANDGTPADQAALAAALNTLANEEFRLGSAVDACAAAQQAVRIYGSLSENSPQTYLPDLAMALNTLANRQAALGEHDQALDASDRSVRAYAELARRDPQAFEANLAMALNGLANRQAAYGDLATSVVTAERSVNLRRRLVQTSPAAQPQLAMSLNSLAVRYRDAGDLDRSIEVAGEAVGIYRQLDPSGADVARATAMALSNLSVALADDGRRHEARTAAAEVVATYEAIRDTMPGAYEREYSVALNNLSHRELAIGAEDAAAQYAEAAVAIRRRLLAGDVESRADLASALTNLSNRQTRIGYIDAALGNAVESVELYRVLVSADHATWEDELTRALNNYAIVLSIAHRHDDALAAMREVVHRRRRIVEQQPHLLSTLASALNNLAVRHAAVGDLPAALRSGEESVRLLEALAAARPARHEPDLALALGTLGSRYSEAGRHDDAIAAHQRSVAIYRRLATDDPVTYQPRLGPALTRCAEALGAAERRLEAIAIARDAVALTAALVEQDRARRPILASALVALSAQHAARGDLGPAVRYQQDAQRIYREISAIDASTYLPRLIMTTENLTSLQAADGRPAEAAAHRAEAVQLWRQLFASRPTASVAKAAAFLLSEPGVVDEPARANEVRAVAGCASPGRGAQLLAAYGAYLLGRGGHDAPAVLLDLAVTQCDREENSTVQGEARRSVRRAVQALLRMQQPGAAARRWPNWAAAPADTALLTAVDAWLAADLDGREELLRSMLDTFTGPGAADTRAIAQLLHPEDAGHAELRDALDAIAGRGLHEGIARYRDDAEHRRLIDEWTTLTDAATSLSFLREHPSLPTDPRTPARLATRVSPDSVQVSLQRLAGHIELGDLSAAIGDPDAAEDLVLRLIDGGELEYLAPLLSLLPDRVLSPVRRAETAALAALAMDPPDMLAAERQMEVFRVLASAERLAFAVSRLRLLARRHLNLRDHLAAMTEILTSSSRSES
ncbi:lipopolysaccharide biosynthesis regulator YciM [Actinoplanes tereljensis]|uniref:Tetratricopeptide repeat protein n=1 Tax=Paractinoplanes tereljensis TaxID=571912 RepID=A0A919NWW2_9ACTN|nr:tetratricopeptide repeat protein [Actinoplanes tereljensis]GIF26821.1 hypothetical protein Ate02nite_95510 [Actinoplanes tereljensis]